MKDNKFKVLIYLAVSWAALFLLTMKFKSPRLEQINILLLLVCFCWFAYWTISTIVSYMKGDTTVKEKIETEIKSYKSTEKQESNAKSKKTPKSE